MSSLSPLLAMASSTPMPRVARATNKRKSPEEKEEGQSKRSRDQSELEIAECLRKTHNSVSEESIRHSGNMHSGDKDSVHLRAERQYALYKLRCQNKGVPSHAIQGFAQWNQLRLASEHTN